MRATQLEELGQVVGEVQLGAERTTSGILANGQTVRASRPESILFIRRIVITGVAVRNLTDSGLGADLSADSLIRPLGVAVRRAQSLVALLDIGGLGGDARDHCQKA